MAICMVWWDLKWKEIDFRVQRDCTLQRCHDPWAAGPVDRRARVLLILHVSSHLNKSAKVRTYQKSSQAGGRTHTQMPEHQEEPRVKEGQGKKGRRSPHCFRPLGRGEHMQFTESTLHSHFKQIRGWAGRYHLECPVMGNWVGKGAVHLWLIFTKVFVCVFSQMLTTRRIELNKKDTVDWIMVLCPSNSASSLLGLWWILFFNSRLVFVKNLLRRLRGSQEWRNARLAAINHLLLEMNWSFFFKVTVQAKVSDINMQSVRAITVAWSC